jgi:hypothetical protein
LGFFEAALGIAVVALGIWLLIGSSPQSRPPALEPRARFSSRRDEADLRRSRGDG